MPSDNARVHLGDMYKNHSDNYYSRRPRAYSPGYPLPQRPQGPFEPCIDASLGGRDVATFPDTGAAGNFISLSYAEKHRLRIDRTSASPILIGNGSIITMLGTTSLPFTFARETRIHNLEFAVLGRSKHDVILGSQFLQMTETFTRFSHRVRRRLRDVLKNRVCVLGSQQYISGRANGVRVEAIPDTGADLCLMSASFAKLRGFKVDASDKHHIPLEFADGSTTLTTGMIEHVSWTFEGTREPFYTNVYVLPNLPADMLLSYDFLCHTDAFAARESSFYDLHCDLDCVDTRRSSLNVVQIASKWIERAKSRLLSSKCSRHNGVSAGA